MGAHITHAALVLAVGVALCGVTLDAAAQATAAQMETRFPDPSGSWIKGGAFVDVERLRRMGHGLNKGQVRELIGPPHFATPIFGASTWDYLFNVRTGKDDEYASCQYQVRFEEGLSAVMSWNKPECEKFIGPRMVSTASSMAGLAGCPALPRVRGVGLRSRGRGVEVEGVGDR